MTLLSFFFLLYIIFLISIVAVWLSSFIAFFKYAGYYQRNIEKELVLFPKFIWFLMIIVSGPIGAILFWILHHSTLNPTTTHR